MTPAARLAAAIELLDRVLDGTPAEQALTHWARKSRFAGSKDRQAIRDIVFDALRKRAEYQWHSGQPETALSGRALMIGALRAQGVAPEDLFTGEGYAPPPLTADERGAHTAGDEMRADPVGDARGAQGMGDAPPNMPLWIMERLAQDMGQTRAAAQDRHLSDRAPVTLRVHAERTTRAALARDLRAHGIDAVENELAPDALSLSSHPRGLTGLAAFRAGLFELQDAASQAVTYALEPLPGPRILDFCAGGGGKSLALAARNPHARITAHDANPQRLRDLPDRARRAGAALRIVTDSHALEPGGFDLVLLDVPCSGSGSWRRAPDAKWRFTPDDLEALLATQAQILDAAHGFVREGGALAYVTCSILRAENDAQAEAFCARHPRWTPDVRRQWWVSAEGDGMFLQVFR